MPEVLAVLLLFFFLLSIGLTISLSSFALSDPQAFSHWAPIMSWIFKIKGTSTSIRSWFSWVSGVFFVILTVILSFVFGSLAVTLAFGLWTSPIMRYLTGD